MIEVNVKGSPKLEVNFESKIVKIEGGGIVDSALSLESENPVMNKVITEELNKINRNLQDIPTDIVTEESLSFELSPYWYGADPTRIPDNPIPHYRKNPVVFYSGPEGVSALASEMTPLLVWRANMLMGMGVTSIFVAHNAGSSPSYAPATLAPGSQGLYLIWEDKENHYELLINNTNTQPTITPKQPDWLINTASHNGFIKNKTHGLNVYDVFIDGAKMMVGNNGTGIITWSKETSFGNVADSNIALLINNNIYPILEAISEEDFLPNEDNTIKSMPIVVAGNSGVIHVNRVSGTTIKIGITIRAFEFMSYSLVGYRSIQQLSELFIPNTIARVSDLEKGLSSLITPILYADLVALRDAGQLKAGTFYRITDYVTTTIQENTRSAGNLFDVIVTALSKDTLAEEAYAIQREFNIEDYKDAYSTTRGEKMLYLGTYDYNGKTYHRYESGLQEMQMLVDFDNLKFVGADGGDYKYIFYPSYIGYNNDEWYVGEEEFETICFKTLPTYFANSNLAAWKLWYCLDNDAKRFAWARTSLYSPITKQKMIIVTEGGESYIYVRDSSYDSDGKCAWLCEGNAYNLSFLEYIKLNNESLDTGDIIYTDSEELEVGTELDMTGVPVWLVDISWATGKGVIYRLIDEWNNDCPYDFKNIQYKRNLTFDEGNAQFSEDGVETWVYTFAGQSYHVNNDEYSDMLDGSLESPYGHMSDENTSTFHDNTIKPYIMVYNGNDVYTECGIRYLNDNVFLGYWEEIGSANEEDAPYYFAYCCHNNSFGNDCHNNSFGNDCSNNSFGNDCSNNSFGYSCHNNSFGYSCSSNSFGSDCYNNSLYEVLNTTILSGVANARDIDRSYVVVATNSQGEVKVFNIADLVE